MTQSNDAFCGRGEEPAVEIIAEQCVGREPPIASFLKLTLVGGGPVNASVSPHRTSSVNMTPAPKTVGGFPVVCYSPIDERHRFTGQTKQVVRGVLMGAMSGLAICQLPDSEQFYLFGCDGDWNVITDTWHQSLDDAKEQAEFEYEGVSRTWSYVG